LALEGRRLAKQIMTRQERRQLKPKGQTLQDNLARLDPNGTMPNRAAPAGGRNAPDRRRFVDRHLHHAVAQQAARPSRRPWDTCLKGVCYAGHGTKAAILPHSGLDPRFSPLAIGARG